MTTPTDVSARMAQRYDTASNWTTYLPILLAGEIGIESDTGKYKIGNGNTSWGALPYGSLPGGGGEVTGNITLNAQGDLRFADSDSSNWVAFQAPGTVTANVTWTLPDADATVSGYALISDAAGNLSWGEAGGGATGGGSDDVFYENSQTVTADYTISTNKNAMTAGPVSINSGITVTVPSGSSWVIV